MKKNKRIWFVCGLFGALFVVLLSIRLGVFQHFLASPQDTAILLGNPTLTPDAWMNILQNRIKIGYLHTNLSKLPKGYKLRETMHIRINTMGMVQDIYLKNIYMVLSDFHGCFGFQYSKLIFVYLR